MKTERRKETVSHGAAINQHITEYSQQAHTTCKNQKISIYGEHDKKIMHSYILSLYTHLYCYKKDTDLTHYNFQISTDFLRFQKVQCDFADKEHVRFILKIWVHDNDAHIISTFGNLHSTTGRN